MLQFHNRSVAGQTHVLKRRVIVLALAIFSFVWLCYASGGVQPLGEALKVEGGESSGIFIWEEAERPPQYVEVVLRNTSGKTLRQIELAVTGETFRSVEPVRIERLRRSESREVRVPIKTIADVSESDRLSGTIEVNVDDRTISSSVEVKVRRRDDTTFDDVRGFRVFSADLHCYSSVGGGTLTPRERIWEAWEDGIDILAITDENAVDAYDKAKETAAECGILLLRGQKLTGLTYRSSGHFIVLGGSGEPVASTMPLDDFRKAFQEIGRQDTVVIWAHPSMGRDKGDESLDLKPNTLWAVLENLLDGAEIKNAGVGDRWGAVLHKGSWMYPQAMDWYYENNLAVIASSGARGPARQGDKLRPRTLLLADHATWPEIKDAIERGRTVAVFDEMFWGDRRWVSPLLKSLVELPAGVIPGKPIVLGSRCKLPLTLRFASLTGTVFFTDASYDLPAGGTVEVPTIYVAAGEMPDLVRIEVTVLNAFVQADRNASFVVEMALRGVRGVIVR